METKDLILRIVQLKPSITTFHIAKLAYLFDLACVQLFGEPRSGIPFRWHLYGPYCDELEAAIWQLEDEVRIHIEPHTTRLGHDCRLHTPVTGDLPAIDSETDQILRFVVDRFGNMATKELSAFVYATPPMAVAQKRNARFQPLDLRERADVPPDLYDPAVMRMLIRSAATPESEYIPAEEVFRQLDAIALPTPEA